LEPTEVPRVADQFEIIDNAQSQSPDAADSDHESVINLQ
jgi:hypothetical protein